jgi:hypothetical protein
MSEQGRFIVVTHTEIPLAGIEVGLIREKEVKDAFYPMIASHYCSLVEELFTKGVMKYVMESGETAYVAINDNNPQANDIEGLIRSLGGRSVTEQEWSE